MKKSRFSRIRTFWGGLSRLGRILVIAFLVAAVASSALAFTLVRDLVLTTTSFQLPGLAINASTSQDPESGEVVQEPAQQIGPDLEPWDGSSRVTILFMGLDHRDWEANEGAPRTDSMILFTIDPVSNTAGMLSLPRDLWVEVPGYGHQKINNAYSLGEGSRLPGGGPGLAVRTVEDFLGVTINYYAQVDFYAFERFIDEIGGIKIDVKFQCPIQLIGETEFRIIRKGVQTLPGAYALGYARARHQRCGNGDFDRAERQQEVVIAIRNQLLRPDIQGLILSDGLRIYQELSSGVKTNMTFQEMLSLGWLAKDIDLSNIRQGIISTPDHVQLATSPDGLSILKPITQNIRLLRDYVFDDGNVRSAVAVSAEDSELLAMEGAQVWIYNGSGVSGLADSTRAYLESMGVQIGGTGNADLVGGTTIFDYTGNPYTMKFLVQIMEIEKTRIYSRYDPNSEVDIEIILGPNWTVP